MNNTAIFDFGNNSVAIAYDNILVPALFEPWAMQLVEDNSPWKDLRVLDLACGTGAATKEIAKHILPNGKLHAVDINPQMLAIAKDKCSPWKGSIEFMEGSSDQLDFADNSMDVVVCQQGFQFFPNKQTTANEMFRILKPGGKVIISTWCTVDECEVFGAICETLEALEEAEISNMMRMPFDFLSQKQLVSPFEASGFTNIVTTKKEMALIVDGEGDSASLIAYATPIGPKLIAMPDDRQEAFKHLLAENIRRISPDGKHFGQMASNVLIATK